MRSGEVHYIDHPLLGVLLRIDRYRGGGQPQQSGITEDEAEAAPAAEEGDAATRRFSLASGEVREIELAVCPTARVSMFRLIDMPQPPQFVLPGRNRHSSMQATAGCSRTRSCTVVAVIALSPRRYRCPSTPDRRRSPAREDRPGSRR